ncbi:MAG: transcriptional repressor [Kofleriaceae bacterium]|nr:transcriptional repressor [Kofleriaceae bacterium]
MSSRARERLDAVRRALHACGLRATPARIAVLDVLRSAGVPLSVDDVQQRLDGVVLDRTTVFRNLTALMRVGLARRLDLGDRRWRFIRVAAGAWATFVCTGCGEVQPLERVRFAVGMPGAPGAIARREIALYAHGRCDRCAR